MATSASARRVGQGLSFAGGRVLSQKKSGGPTFVLATGLRAPRAIAVDQKHVYWLNNGDGKVCRTEMTPRPKP